MDPAQRNVATKYWHALDDGRIQCDLCPRFCKLREGQRGMCFVRAREGDQVVLTTYGRSSGFCIDPIEKKPLNHFLPGTSVLSFGTAGCNLGCQFCQNWDISKSREIDTLSASASPEAIARAAHANGCRSVAFTYNDPVIFMEYAIDVAKECRKLGIATVAVTAGEICEAPRREFFEHMDAANVDLKAFTQDFYWKICKGDLQTVLDTLVYLKRETSVWFEITTLLIPGKNDSDKELRAMSRWIMQELGPDIPLHFSAFHPDYRMLDVPPTPPQTLTRARRIALEAGLHHVYVGNVHDEEGSSTYCAGCA
ncbi:MAG TPA: AmmeMemoRadiSam system radical SAM enzyme, partial [Candidatus Krumholzibacteria bacterium]